MKHILIVLFILLLSKCWAQYGVGSYHNVSLTFLETIPDARIGGFGEVDAITSPYYSNTGLLRNPALLSKHQVENGISVSYMPYLRKFVNDLNLISANGYYALNEKNAVGMNLTMFDQGEQLITDETGMFSGKERVYDLFLQGTYNHSFNNSISSGLSIKYIHSQYGPASSNITGNLSTLALDFGFNFDDQYNLSETSLLNTSLGISISNFGPKLSYDNYGEAFLPTKLLLGLFINPDLYINETLRLNIELGYQAEKYLVPTEPVYDFEGNIISGYSSDINSFTALYQSFYDAPGGFDEEIHEILHKFGSEFRLEIGSKSYIALRHGRIIEHETKGNRKYQTFGLGGGYDQFMLDFKLIEFAEFEGLNGTWALSVGYRFKIDHD